MSNDKLRSAVRSAGFSVAEFADEIGVDPKTAQRWMTLDRTPHRTTATRAAKLLGVPPSWLWPELDRAEQGAGDGEVIGFYAHRAQVPKMLWRDLLIGATQSIDLATYAALHLVEDHPETVTLLAHKASIGVQVRIAMGDPDAPAIHLRGEEEQMTDGLVGRVRMANAYYAPLINAPGVQYRLHHTTLYNSIYRYDDQMIVNHHVYGLHGYLAPALHLRKSDAGDLFATYAGSFDRLWKESYQPAGS
ncbi:helix-turn-helix domain-containing protein [Cellulomonas aerilata]|uniref:XRE family transcriptional regulator n=1 Tax=Cellulomonas aerilata TaxID=515326 RepID=A0A512DF91_9CELL|nr:helix-turn-helix transcriptional regulator [Cellulomonas aerilata]GEO35154.1 XRE family transcriptional regulator [Cellulomonas aerilata]